MLYVIYDQATGAQKRVSADLVLQPVLVSEGVKTFPSLTREPDSNVMYWNPETLDYEFIPGSPAAPISRVKLTKREFLQRVGKTTIGQINAIIITPATTPQQVAMVAELMTMKDFLNASDFVDLTNQLTIDFAQGLVDLGFKTTQEKAALLTPSTVVEE